VITRPHGDSSRQYLPLKKPKHFSDQSTQVVGLIAFYRFGARLAREIVNLSDTSTWPEASAPARVA
jgi:hypothetical protein